MITQAELKRRLSYDPETGVFVWIDVSKYHLSLNGKVAGSIRVWLNTMYRWICIDGHSYSAHRLAWLYIYGRWPTMIDHVNGESLDNRINNLREATHEQNNQNHTKEMGKSGLPVGVRRTCKRYAARITANKIVYYLGGFDTPEEAKEAYLEKRKEVHDAPALKELV